MVKIERKKNTTIFIFKGKGGDRRFPFDSLNNVGNFPMILHHMKKSKFANPGCFEPVINQRK